MAERKIIYSIKINGVEQSTKDIKILGEEINNLGDSVSSLDMSENTFSVDGIENINTEITQTGEKFDSAGNSVNNFDANLDKLSSDSVVNVGKNLDSTTEKVDKLTFAGEKGFKGLSDALKLFGVDTSILDNVKEGLGAIGDLLDSNSKLNDVAHNSAPAAKQAETIKELAGAQKAANTATNAGTIATTASSTATKGATFATQAFNVALRALPFLAVIGAITTVIALYKNWKDAQKENAENLASSFKLIEQEINNVSDKYEELNQNVETNSKFNQIGADARIQQLNEELKLLEINGATAQQIANKRTEILKAEIALQQQLITYNNTAITNAGNQISEYDALISKLTKANNDLRDLNAKEKDSEIRQINQQSINDNEKIINDTILEQNKLNQKRNDLNLENAKIENDINIKKQFGVKLINAQTAEENKKLEVLKEQEKIKLSEELKKVGLEIFQNYLELKNFNDEFFRLYNELEQSVNKDKLKIAVDAGDFDKAFDLLINSLDNFDFELKNKKENIIKNLAEPLIQARVSLLDFQSKIKDELKIRLKLEGVEEIKIDSTIKNIEDKLSNLKFDISSAFEFDLPVNFQTQVFDKIFKSNITSIQNYSNEVIDVREKTKNGLVDLTPEEYFLFDLDKLSKNFNITDGILNQNFVEFLSYQLELKKSISSIKEELDTEFQLKGFSTESTDSLNQFVNSLINTDKSLSEVNKKVTDTFDNQTVVQSAVLKTFTEKINETSNLLKNVEGNFTESFDNIQNIVDANLDGLQDKFNNGENLNFKLFLNNDLKEQLKLTLSEPVQKTIDDLNKKKAELQRIFEELIKLNPNNESELKNELNGVLSDIDGFIVKLEKKVEDNNKKVELTFKEFYDKYAQLIFDTLQASVDLYAAINDLQIQSLEQQMEVVDEYYDGIADKYEEEIERTQEFYDQQAQIANDSISKINDYENQLKTARGARAEFLLKLIAAEQEKNQKAEKAKLDALKKEQLAKKEAAKAEEERAAELDALARKRFNLQKANNMAQIILSTTVAVMKALAQDPGPPTTIPLAVITGVLGAVQLGIAASAKYEQGGVLDVMENGGELSGPRHSAGGLAVINMQTGQKVAEVEGEEFIVNRQSTANKNNYRVINNINKDANYMDDKMVVRTTDIEKLEKYSQSLSKNNKETIKDNQIPPAIKPVKEFEDGGLFFKDIYQNYKFEDGGKMSSLEFYENIFKSDSNLSKNSNKISKYKINEIDINEFDLNNVSKFENGGKLYNSILNNNQSNLSSTSTLNKNIKNNYLETGGILSKIENFSTPNYSNMINSITNANNNRQQAVNVTPIVQANVDSESITNAIIDGMANVNIQASIQDIIQQNNNQVQIDNLRRI